MNSHVAPEQPLLTLPGSVALSAFRVDKLLAGLKPGLRAAVSIDTRFVHFALLSQPLTAAEADVLAKILTYGTPGKAEPRGELRVVLPRFGTVSPWSSKATDIARNCGLGKVARIERGVAWYFAMQDGKPLRAKAERALAEAIHDRMTETVVGGLGEARRLFAHHAPGPLATVDLQGGGPQGARGGQFGDGPRARARRDRLPRRELREDGAQPHRRRAHDVRAGEQRALPAQDLQRLVDHRRQGARTRASSR